MITLEKEQVKRLNQRLLDATGGLDGFRDEAMLDSALSAAFQTFDGVDHYPSTAAKIARTAYGLVCNIVRLGVPFELRMNTERGLQR